MKHSFALTTRQIAKLAKSEIPPIYMSVRRYGHWRSIVPRRTPSGRLLWRTDEVHAALGIVPCQNAMTPAEQLAVRFLEREALPLNGEVWAFVQGILSHKTDEGRDPTDYADEACFIAEIVNAFVGRVFDVELSLNGRDRERIKKALRYIAETTAQFTDEVKEAEHA